MARRGDDIDMATTQNMLEDLQTQIDELSSGSGSDATAGGLGDLTFVAFAGSPSPGSALVSIRQEKHKPVVALQVAIPSGTFELKVVLEQYTGAGPGAVTVIRKFNGTVEVPDSIKSSGGIFVFDFPERLEYNATFGGLKLIAFMDVGGKVKNPATDPAESPRLLTDYLPASTFSTTAAFNPPLGAREILIREAGFSPATKKFLAYDTLRLFGPLTNAGIGQSLRAANVDMIQPRVTELNEQTTLNGGITNVATTIVLTSAAGFSQGDQVFIVDANGTGELVLLGVKAVNTFTGCTRAQEGTPAAAHSNGVGIWRLTKIAHDNKAKNLTDAELDQVAQNPDGINNCGYVDQTIDGLAPGTPLVWIGNHASAAGQKTQSTGAALFFWAGDIARAGTGITELTAVSATAFQTAPNDGRSSEFIFSYTQPTPSAIRPTAIAPTGLPVALESVQTIRDATLVKDTDRLDRRDYTTSGIHNISLGETKTKKFTTHNFSFNVLAFGGASRSIAVIVNTGEWTGGDTVVPVLVTNPDTGTTGPTVKERHSKIDVSCLAADASIAGSASVDIFQVIVSSNAAMSSTAGTPVVGVNGVLAIKQGQHVTFNLSYLQALTGDVYCYYRIHNKSGANNAANGVGWSLWSAATNQHGYSRPIQDFIGSGVPVLPIRLEFTDIGTGGSTTTFVGSILDTTDYQTFITAGISFHIMILTLAGANIIRKITAYNSGTQTFTVSPAWSVTPGVVSYQIHRGLSVGEPASGVANTTTTINLGTLGAAFANDTFTGAMVYMPVQPDGTDALRGDRIRRIITHTGGVITFETAVAAALPTGSSYAISLGSFGSQFVGSPNATGIIAGVPIRVWYDSATDNNVLEVRMPVGETAFSSQGIELIGWRLSNGKKKIPFIGNVSVNPTYTQKAPSGFQPMWTMRLQNMYRDGGSDGWSIRSYYTQGYQLAAAPATFYDPSVFPTTDIDFQTPASYPTQRYPAYQ